MLRAKVVAAVYVVALVASVVAVRVVQPGEDGVHPGPPMELAASLESFDGCEDALAFLTENAAAQGDGSERLARGAVPEQAVEESAAAGDAAVPAPAPVPDAAGGADQAFSGTNVQEAGVDEPDLVKTDGRRIVTVADGRLSVVDATNDEPRLLGTLDLPGEAWGQELLLDGDRALVFSSTWTERPQPSTSPVEPAGPQSVLTLVELAETATPRVASTLSVEGEYVSARMVDGVARVVLRSHPHGPVADVPAAGGASGGQPAAEATIAEWVPSYRLEAETTVTDQLVECDQILRPAQPAGTGMVTVLSVDLAGQLQPGAATTVVADAQTVYASPDMLYVAFGRWDTGESTEIHAFDISDPAGAVYTASGAVPGRLLNQWALSEHAGFLRVATTEGQSFAVPEPGVAEPGVAEPGLPEPAVDEPAPSAPVDPDTPVSSSASAVQTDEPMPVDPWPMEPAPPPGPEPAPSSSAVTVLEVRGDELAQVGRVEGLGPTERIYAVRFMGDVGYVVTFRETDPLYTLDLSDPANPRVVGELKILGYSAYLHPLGDGLLLGVGQDATEQGRILGTQLSLFDVSDLGHPERVHQTTIPGAHSGVEHDHRAFLHWPPTGTIVLPLEIHHDEPVVRDRAAADGMGPTGFMGAAAFTVDRAAGFAEVGRVSHTEQAGDPWRGAIRRSLVIGDSLYTVSEAGVGANDLRSLERLGFVPLAGS